MCLADHASNLCLPKTPSAPTKHFVTMLHALTVVSSHRRTSDLDVDDSLGFSHALTFSRTTGGISQGPHPAIVLPAATDRTKSVPNTGKYTGISAY